MDLIWPAINVLNLVDLLFIFTLRFLIINI